MLLPFSLLKTSVTIILRITTNTDSVLSVRYSFTIKFCYWILPLLLVHLSILIEHPNSYHISRLRYIQVDTNCTNYKNPVSVHFRLHVHRPLCYRKWCSQAYMMNCLPSHSEEHAAIITIQSALE